ncbi:hypothetical protein BASA81_011241 [Batrachochytrium salamandrivorans]|nr:hypothetical protein BASA81_011241 [Batrachochytrium salamandrivorans]
MLWSMPSMVGTTQALSMISKPSSIPNKDIDRTSSIVNKDIDRTSSIVNKDIDRTSSIPNKLSENPRSLFKPDPPTPQPPYVKVTSTSDECGKIADENGMTPFKEWGKLTESMKTTWGQQGCDQKMCQYWAKSTISSHLKMAAQCQKT